MKRFKAAVVGAGFAGQQHIDALRRLGNVDVVALADSNEKVLTAKGELLSVRQLYPDWKEMLRQENVDVVHNCTPNGMHYEVNRYALERGLPVYCEKPLATNLDDAWELAAIAGSKKLANGVNFNYRNSAPIREMRHRFLSGEAGRPFLVHGKYIQDWLQFETDYSWRLDVTQNGRSRTVADIGSHWFDTVQCILDTRIVKVQAKLRTVHNTRKKPDTAMETFSTAAAEIYHDYVVESEDLAAIMVEFADGTLGSTVLSQVSGGHKNDFEIWLDSQQYSMGWNQEKADKLYIGTRSDGITQAYASPATMHGDASRFASLPAGHPMGWSDALRNSMYEFYTHMEHGGARTYADFADAYYVMEIVEACLRSNETGQWKNVKAKEVMS